MYLIYFSLNLEKEHHNYQKDIAKNNYRNLILEKTNHFNFYK